MKRYFYNIITQGSKEPVGWMIRLILICLSFLYLMALKLRRKLYDLKIFKAQRLKASVISVGNITWGGTGKTPLVETICLHFGSEGKKIALLTRGYGMDEDKVLAQNLPMVSVLAGKNRVENARSKEAEGPLDMFILDDGFQHWEIKTDIDIVTINATDPFGNGRLIPAGILREPLTHLSRADLIVLTKSNLIERSELDSLRKKILELKPNAEIFESTHQPLCFYNEAGDAKDLKYVKEKKTALIAALGDNDSFHRMNENICDDIRVKVFYMDHHGYTRTEIEKFLKECKDHNVETVITTEKDWAKLENILKEIPRVEFLILKIKISIYDEKKFFGRLSPIISG